MIQFLCPSGKAKRGRPKDLSKRAAILEAAQKLFLAGNFERVTMDDIAAMAGVSKLTLYSHFGEKEALFAESFRSYTLQQLPDTLFEVEAKMPVREALTRLARQYFATITTHGALRGFCLLSSDKLGETKVSKTLWREGPVRAHLMLEQFLKARVASGELELRDPLAAAGHFLSLVRGRFHPEIAFNLTEYSAEQIDAHVLDAVDCFCRAYETRPAAHD